MNPQLERKLRTSEQLARNCDIEAALALAGEAIAEAPDEARAFALRAFVHELAEQHSEARRDLTKAIEISGAQPALLYARGRMAYLSAALEDAVDDFTHALRLIDEQGIDDDRQELHFWRAAARIGLGASSGALEDLRHVNDGFCTWTNGLLSKADLLAQCE